MEADELASAQKRIARLEAELALTRDACELFDEQEVVPPKCRRAIAEGLIARGHSARSACRITGLARWLLQYYRRRPVPDREMRRLIVADTIAEIHQRSRGTDGRRRIRAALLADYDMNVNRKLVKSIMTEHGLHGLPRPGRRLPNLIRPKTLADLVNRQFTATGPTSCCAILDCFSRMIVVRTFSTTADAALVNNAVNMAARAETAAGQRFCTPTTAPNLRPGASGRTSAGETCWPRSARSATVSITPRWSRSGPGYKSNCSTPENG